MKSQNQHTLIYKEDSSIKKQTDIKTDIKTDINMMEVIEKKIVFFSDLIQKTILHIQKTKNLSILGINDVHCCIQILENLNNKIIDINENIHSEKETTDLIINKLQVIINELSVLIKQYGTESLEDLISICFGNNSIMITSYEEIQKYDLLKKYFHPTSYRLSSNKNTSTETDITISATTTSATTTNTMNAMNTMNATTAMNATNATNATANAMNATNANAITAIEENKNLDCIDVSLSSKIFHMKVFGIKIYICNKNLKKTLVITGILDNIIVPFLNNKYITTLKQKYKTNFPKNLKIDMNVEAGTFERYINSLSLKDYLINNNTEINHHFIGLFTQNKAFKTKNLQQITKEFTCGDLFFKRNYLIHLLIMSHSNCDDNKFIAYLLYDLLSNDSNSSNSNIDTTEQMILIDSFPWTIKQQFNDAMKNTIQYTTDLTNFDMNKIPLEQQICLLKAPESVKEKAMMKLKEVKAKSEDSGSKARQYLDGLLKIPFQIFKKEPIMHIMNDIKEEFFNLCKNEEVENLNIVEVKDTYTSIEVLKNLKTIKKSILHTNENIKKIMTSGDKTILHTTALKINELIKVYQLSLPPYTKKTVKKTDLKIYIEGFITACVELNNTKIIEELNVFANQREKNKWKNECLKNISRIDDKMSDIHSYISNVKSLLDVSVYGHEKAKKKIEIIIAQWINGDQSGYCFGFEGAPGVGKTSLAKNGLSQCLTDENGQSRPFAMIQIAGDSNGSTLHGHNYTYVGSTWGSIVQILMDKKCMNPIIFIDEVDKISKTEHGKEIVGILTHLLDSTQNDCFQDKYFNGVDLDLSKALFILSYNDPEAIDKILLDRIHRIKFNNLSLEDKLIICKKHLLPEIYKKVGLEGMIHMEENLLLFIIENYTLEAGVRKLKEVLFEIIGEINLDILKNKDIDYEKDLPIVITIEDIKTKYFKDKQEVRIKKIHSENKVGVIHCLYATTSGQSGILSAIGQFYPCDKFLDLKLTGLLDDMMKESFQISMTLAYNLTDEDTKMKLREKYDGEHKFGIHLHMGDGSINKSGTSAGIAITLLFYSMLNNRKIKNTFAITGEAGLDGLSNEIGALSQKFLGGIKAGVTSFIFPLENKRDYDQFMEKYKDKDIIKDIAFYPITHINEAIQLIFE